MKKTIYIFVLVLVIISCKTTENRNSEANPKSVDLVLDFSRQIPGPFLEITIGEQNYTAFVDTGNTSSIISVSDEIIQNLNLLPIGEQRSITTAGEVTNKQYLLSNFTINGKIEFNDVICTSMPPKNYAPNEKPDAILGLSAFADYNILIAYDERKIYLYDKNITHEYFNNWVKVDLLPDRSGLFFYGNINSDEDSCLFYLDTGTFVRIRGQLYDQVLNQKIASNLSLNDGDATFIFGGEQIFNNRVYAARSNNMTDVDIFLGLNFLLNHNVFIDLDNSKLLVKN